MSENDHMGTAVRWDALASIIGFNELATNAKTLGEKVYFRMARGAAEKRYASLGGELNKSSVGPTILTIGPGPFIEFAARDIELMRETVAKFDQKRRLEADPASKAAALDLDRVLEEIAQQFDVEAFIHETDVSKYPAPLPHEVGYAYFYGREYARALYRSWAAKIRARLSTSPPALKPIPSEDGFTAI